MKLTTIFNKLLAVITSSMNVSLLRSFFSGLLIPCGFAPFHMPGLSILGIALLFAQIQQQTLKQAFTAGLMFGLGFFGLGVSWIYVSIHDYGHLNALLSGFITLLFILYLALYPAVVTLLYQRLSGKRSTLFKCFLFSALWCLAEFLRATFMSGFPWLLLGFGQIDTPLNYLLPILGVFGVGFITCLLATFLATGMKAERAKRYPWIIAFVAMLLLPSLLQNQQWTAVSSSKISVGVIQANLSMRDKWDEALFWQLLKRYDDYAGQLLGKKQLIVMPESAIPIPANYVTDFLEDLNLRAKNSGSAVLLGIPEPTSVDDTAYHNSLTTLGMAQGSYLKQHLVPFGEFIPKPFQQISNWLSIPVANMLPGKALQPLVYVHDHPIATLICYELAYPQLLRSQLPQAEWIVSISDDGWFGHSLAMYQQLQIAQVLSLQTGRFQIVANNDGLSSIIDAQGKIISSLPAFSAGVLNAEIRPATGASPWVSLGDAPILLVCLLIMVLTFYSFSKESTLYRAMIGKLGIPRTSRGT